jgi:hypothetical protein
MASFSVRQPANWSVSRQANRIHPVFGSGSGLSLGFSTVDHTASLVLDFTTRRYGQQTVGEVLANNLIPRPTLELAFIDNQYFVEV